MRQFTKNVIGHQISVLMVIVWVTITVALYMGELALICVVLPIVAIIDVVISILILLGYLIFGVAFFITWFLTGYKINTLKIEIIADNFFKFQITKKTLKFFKTMAGCWIYTIVDVIGDDFDLVIKVVKTKLGLKCE